MADDKPNIALVTAHPDDVAFGMGGTAWLLKDKYKLHVFCASKGERGYPAVKGKPHPPDEKLGAIRAAEEAAACKMLGAELTFLGLIDGEIHGGAEAARDLAGKLAALKPVAMITLWPVNTPDHTALSNLATKAMRLAEIFYTSEVYYFEIGLGGATTQFLPDVYVNISDVIEHKRDLIRCHKSHGPAEETVENYTRENVFRGLQARCEYAEAFKTPDPVVNSRWGRKPRYLLLDL